jgi:hypothetical protein
MLPEILNLKYTCFYFGIIQVDCNRSGTLRVFCGAVGSYVESIEDRECVCQAQSTFIIPEMLISRQHG